MDNGEVGNGDLELKLDAIWKMTKSCDVLQRTTPSMHRLRWRIASWFGLSVRVQHAF